MTNKEINIKSLDEIQMGEIILIDKEYGKTSFYVIKKLKHYYYNLTKNKKFKVGHAGTLDPLATGLLIICTGKQTKNIYKYQNLDKEYIGTITIGATTPSYDLETEIENIKNWQHITIEEINNTANSFVGNSLQTPPIFSAKKIDGQRAYEKARKNEKFELKQNEICINKFEIRKIDANKIEFLINCSKGTYIRSIANDFGEKLKCGAYLSSLRRTKIGDFDVDNAQKIDNYESYNQI